MPDRSLHRTGSNRNSSHACATSMRRRRSSRSEITATTGATQTTKPTKSRFRKRWLPRASRAPRRLSIPPRAILISNTTKKTIPITRFGFSTRWRLTTRCVRRVVTSPRVLASGVSGLKTRPSGPSSELRTVRPMFCDRLTTVTKSTSKAMANCWRWCRARKKARAIWTSMRRVVSSSRNSLRPSRRRTWSNAPAIDPVCSRWLLTTVPIRDGRPQFSTSSNRRMFRRRFSSSARMARRIRNSCVAWSMKATKSATIRSRIRTSVKFRCRWPSSSWTRRNDSSNRKLVVQRFCFVRRILATPKPTSRRKLNLRSLRNGSVTSWSACVSILTTGNFQSQRIRSSSERSIARWIRIPKHAARSFCCTTPAAIARQRSQRCHVWFMNSRRAGFALFRFQIWPVCRGIRWCLWFRRTSASSRAPTRLHFSFSRRAVGSCSGFSSSEFCSDSRDCCLSVRSRSRSGSGHVVANAFTPAATMCRSFRLSCLRTTKSSLLRIRFTACSRLIIQATRSLWSTMVHRTTRAMW